MSGTGMARRIGVQTTMFVAWRQRVASTLLGMTILLSPTLGITQTATLLPNAKQQYVDDAGNPVASGSVGYYVPGSTTNKKTIWQDANKTTPQTNPVPLDAAGRPQPSGQTYGDGSYQQVVKDVNDVQVWSAVTTSTGGSSGGSTPSFLGDGMAVGSLLYWSGTSLPLNYAYADGSAVSRTTYSGLLTATTISQTITCVSGGNVLSGLSDTGQISVGSAVEATCVVPGTTVTAVGVSTLTISANASATLSTTARFFPWGNGNGSTTFNLLNHKGNVAVGRNNMGGTASSTLTSTYYGINPNGLGASGGSQSKTLVLANLPPYTPAGTVTNGAITISNPSSIFGGTVNGVTVSSAGQSTVTQAVSISLTASQAASSFTGTAQGGTSVPFSLIQPSKTINVLVKVLPDSIISVAGASTGTSNVIVLQDNPTINSPILNTPAIVGATTLSVSGPALLTTESVLPTISTSQNNYNPSSNICTSTSEIQISSSLALNITGLAGGLSGCLLKVVNVGGFSITLKTENLSSTAVNRLAMAADLVLRSQDGTLLTYDGVASRWRQIGGPPSTGGSGGGTVTQVNCGSGLSGGSITTSGTCAVDPKYIGTITAAKYGAVCDGVTDDTVAMNAFADAVGASPNYLGLIVGTSGSVCLMTGTWLVPDNGAGICGGGYGSEGVGVGATVQFKYNGTLIRAKNSTTVRSFGNRFCNFTIEGTSNVTYPNSTAVDMQNASGWVWQNVNIFDVKDGIDVRPTISIITGITKAATAVVTTQAAHGFSNGQAIHIDNVQGMTQVNGNNYITANVTTLTFELQGVNSTGFSTYTGSGTVNLGTTGLDAANYNRFLNVNIQFASGTAFNIEYYANANVIQNSRCSNVGICILDGGDDNSASFSQLEGASAACIQARPTSSTFRSISNRYEACLVGNNIQAGADSFSILYPFYASNGTDTVDGGTATNRFDISGVQVNGGSLLKGFWSQTRAVNFGTVAANSGVKIGPITDFPLNNCLVGDEAAIAAPNTWGGADSFALSAQAANGGVVLNMINQYATSKTPGAGDLTITCRRYKN